MKITKTKLVSGIVIVVALVASYLFMGPQPNIPAKLPAPTTEAAGQQVEGKSQAVQQQPDSSKAEPPAVQPSTDQPVSTVKPLEAAPTQTPEPTKAVPAKESDKDFPKETPTPVANQPAESQPTASQPADKQEIDPKTGKDKYLTEPVPSGKPLPVEPQNIKISDKAMTATLSVTCLTILDNMKLLDKEKVELVPKDGVILPATKVTFYEGESVFNVLQREMKKHKIHMEFVNTPIYNSAYIEGINNLYEFDVGELSGWMFKVNGWFPNYGSSRYQLKDGDVIEWVYTCDLGRDVGDTYNAMGATKQ
ncbi:DUF4430 domain-containing protein [Paenibacillus sp. CGMCC 1.16610]|uniref:DUF4430 domain-containing protein n=1 Tax=Paenibacillus anseongense TaxID=2682845 RepID=A0ABW9UE36_9BACL|nr:MULTISPECIES: DUF4430 domain-containing protein [Paenibacillus]MBA2941945.1 DUF4430 domain-containing protein [Paenibacillus sp. CGMCC 1.16610]MVQ38432.1 DUF4430 domain-containing protein [Paenibacillus anseongense]